MDSQNRKSENPILTTMVSWLIVILLVSQVGLSVLILNKIDPSLFIIRGESSSFQQQENSAPSGNSTSADEDVAPVYARDIPVSETDIVKGDIKTAKVTIIEFGDYQCPFCAQAHISISKLLNKYPDQIAFVYYDFPISSIHANAFSAAEAAHCAGDQGKYWEMHNMLFADQSNLGLESIKARAQKLALDLKLFDNCMGNHKYQTLIEKEMEKGKEYNVSGTPTIFVNGYEVGIPNLSLITEMLATGK